jgi:TolB protein
MFSRLVSVCLILAALFVTLPAGAAMTIEVIGGAASRIPIAIAPFQAAGGKGLDPASVVQSDLVGSGLFMAVDVAGLGKPGEGQAVRHADWRARGADALLIGQATPTADGRFDIRFRLFDVVREKQLAGLSYVAPAHLVRAVAHKIADIVHEKLLGEPGAFSGRLAYILKKAGRYELQVSDVDGYNAHTIANSPEPIISPAWSPDGSKLAYVSFEQKKPVVYVQNLADGKRRALANFRGSNSAPAWSPDSSKLAIVLSKDETSQIYLIDVNGGGLKRVSRGGALETEPVFSPDGKWLYFTSDRGGSPQIYKMPVAGGEVTRVTFGGSYNVSPAISPDGSKLAFVQGEGNSFRVAVLDLATAQTQVLTDTRHDESPSFAPNGRTILYATLVNGRGVLATVSVDGRIRQRLSQTGDLREPSWAP